MNKLFAILAFLLLTANIFAQSPQKMSYQAVIRNSSGVLVINTLIGMEINIRQGSSTGTIVYTETLSPSTNNNGLVSIEIGGEIGFNDIDWANGPFFIETKTAIQAPLTSYTITGTSQLLSVPYALHAKTADNGFSGNYNDLINKPTTISNFIMSADSQNITNLANPVNAQDAVTKAYVDALLVRVQALEEKLNMNNRFLDSRDGNYYNVVTIGEQVWMSENLKYLPSVSAPSEYSTSTPYFYVSGNFGNDISHAKASNYYQNFGALYNWPAAMMACPAGWHLPSKSEWEQLNNYLGGDSITAIKLKETGNSNWTCPEHSATNETGFTAKPHGGRDWDSTFSRNNLDAAWWSSTESGSQLAWLWHITCDNDVIEHNYNKVLGYTIRCVKD
jgi:uncharacterized protein (TIGR02145 family)